jgi:hypothetical protein
MHNCNLATFVTTFGIKNVVGYKTIPDLVTFYK